MGSDDVGMSEHVRAPHRVGSHKVLQEKSQAATETKGLPET